MADTRTIDALGVIVRDPKLARTIRKADPQAFKQAVSAYWKAVHEQTGLAPLYDQDGTRCNGCGGGLTPYDSGEIGRVGLSVCDGCGGIGNTGYGDHIDEVTYREIFAGFETESIGAELRYFDISTVDDGKVERHHGWFWTDKAGQNWICQTG